MPTHSAGTAARSPRRAFPRRPPTWTALLLLAVACSPDPTGALGTDGAPVVARRPDPIAVSVGPVVRERVVSTYSTSGTLRAERQATVTSRTRGVIEQIFAEEGALVEAGQPLAQLENDEQSLAFERAEMVFGMKSREFERSRELNVEELISDAELDLIRRDLEDIQLDHDLARIALERTTVAAPFAGIVTARMLDLGATVSDGTELFALADVDPLYLDVSVPERHVGRLAPGQVVQLYADAADVSADARIERLSPVVDTTTGTVKVTVAVNAEVALRPGAFVEVEVVTDMREDALVVPRSALVAEGRRWLVFKVPAGGDTAEAVEVTLGFDQGDRVEIAGVVGDRTLDAGDRIVVHGASALSDGASLTVISDGSDAAQGAESDGAGESLADGDGVATINGGT